LTFGPRAGDVDRVVALGVDRYIDQQLAAERIDDGLVERRLARFDVLRLSSEELARIYLEEQRARRQRQQAGGRDSAAAEPQGPQGRQLPRARRLQCRAPMTARMPAANPTQTWRPPSA